MINTKLCNLSLVLGLILMTGCSTTIEKTYKTSVKPDVSYNAPTSVKEDYKLKSRFLSIKDDSVYNLKEINEKGISIPLIENPVTLIFIEKEGLTNIAKGFTGCNDYYLKYQISSDILVIGEIVTTNFKCGENDAKFENYLFKELSKNPKIKINKEYILINNKETKMLWENEINKINENEQTVLLEPVVLEDTSNALEVEELMIVENPNNEIKTQEEMLADVFADNKKKTSFKGTISLNEKYDDNDYAIELKSKSKKININSLNLNKIYYYTKDKSANKALRKKALLIRDTLGENTKIINIGLNNGITIPLIEYTIKKSDTLKAIIEPTYPMDAELNWVSLLNRISVMLKLNKDIKNMDSIYPNHKVYMPIFKN